MSAAVKGIAVAVANVTVITATTPSRTRLLTEAIASVAAQSLPVAEHLIGVDLHRQGGAATKNGLIRRVETEWVQLLDDDDLLCRDHVQRLMQEAGPDVDVVYSYASGPGYSGWYNVPFSAEGLQKGNNISHNALVRKSLFDRIGYFGPEYGYDWTFWARAVVAGAKFVCIPEETWIYRISPDWSHESHENSGLSKTREIIHSIFTSK